MRRAGIPPVWAERYGRYLEVVAGSGMAPGTRHRYAMWVAGFLSWAGTAGCDPATDWTRASETYLAHCLDAGQTTTWVARVRAVLRSCGQILGYLLAIDQGPAVPPGAGEVATACYTWNRGFYYLVQGPDGHRVVRLERQLPVTAADPDADVDDAAADRLAQVMAAHLLATAHHDRVGWVTLPGAEIILVRDGAAGHVAERGSETTFVFRAGLDQARQVFDDRVTTLLARNRLRRAPPPSL